jgi:predicted permease
MQNIRYAVRTLARAPGFTLTAVLTLALGIGATAAMMAVVDGVLIKPLPYSAPERLYLATTVVASTTGNAPAASREFPVNAHHFSIWRALCNSCADVALVGGQGVTLTGATAERLVGLQVSHNFFHTLGVQPQFGRDFTLDDEGPGRSQVVLLSDALWRSHFSADPSIVGRLIVLDGVPNAVVGVMPATLRLPHGTEWGPGFGQGRAPEIFQPFGMNMAGIRPMGNFNYAAVIRLKPDASPARASGELTATVSEFARSAGVTMTIKLVGMADRVTASARQGLWLMFWAVAAVLLLVSLNVGSLLLVRNISRSREISVRMALGAARADIVRSMLTEATMLVGMGGTLGWLLAIAALRALVSASPVDIPRLAEIRPDWRVAVFALAAAAAAVALATLAPAWRIARSDLRESLVSATRSATETKGRLRMLDAMMVVEVAVGTAVLIVGILLSGSFLNVMRVERGFATEHIVTQSLSLAGASYSDVDARSRFIDRALESFSAIPGVTLVGETSQLPLRGETWVDSLTDADRPADERTAPLTNRRFVSPGYISAMGISLEQGRDISGSDRSRRVALISERAARLLWPNDNPIGKHVRGVGIGGGTRPGDPLPKDEVVGVVADVKTTGLEQDAPTIVYEPYWIVNPGGQAFVFRTERDPDSLAADIRATVSTIDPSLPVEPPQTMAAIVSAAAAARRFQTSIVVAFAFVAVLTAALGLYGLVSFSVARRTRELGIRIALGATGRQLGAMVLSQGLKPVALGASLGICASLAFADLLASQLYGIDAHDPRIFVVVIVALGAVAIAACWIPARRATKVDPMLPLRAE